jgi:hypothetical protein
MDPRIQIRIRIHTKMSWIRNTCIPQVHVACLVGLVAAMSVQGLANLSAQRAIVGEYSDVQLEEMLEWINANVPPTGVFAGTCNLNFAFYFTLLLFISSYSILSFLQSSSFLLPFASCFWLRYLTEELTFIKYPTNLNLLSVCEILVSYWLATINVTKNFDKNAALPRALSLRKSFPLFSKQNPVVSFSCRSNVTGRSLYRDCLSSRIGLLMTYG